MSLLQLIRETFTADDPHNNRFRIRKSITNYHYFKPTTVDSFGWDLVNMACQPILLKRRRHYGLLGLGYIVSDELRRVFATAGFADFFVFTSVAERIKRPTSSYYDHVFNPLTAKFDIRLSVKEDSLQPAWDKLNREVSSYTVMAALKCKV